MQDARERYGDIIDREHPESVKHPRMPRLNRAAQFAPFAALTGYGEAIDETGRPTEQRIELDEQETAELNLRLTELVSQLPEHPAVTVTYFVPDAKKSGGEYRTVTGAVKRIAEGTIVLADGEAIPVAEIAGLEIAPRSGNENEGGYLR